MTCSNFGTRARSGAHSGSSFIGVFNVKKVVFFGGRYFLGIGVRFCELMYGYFFLKQSSLAKTEIPNIFENGSDSFCELERWCV